MLNEIITNAMDITTVAPDTISQFVANAKDICFGDDCGISVRMADAIDRTIYTIKDVCGAGSNPDDLGCGKRFGGDDYKAIIRPSQRGAGAEVAVPMEHVGRFLKHVFK